MSSEPASDTPSVGELEDVLGLIADALDLLEQQRVAEHQADVAAAAHRDVHDELRPELLLGLVDASVGRVDVGADRLRVGAAQDHRRCEIERVRASPSIEIV